MIYVLIFLMILIRRIIDDGVCVTRSKRASERQTDDGWSGCRHSTADDGRRTTDDDARGRGTNGDDASTGEFSTRDGGYAGVGEEGAR